MKAWPILGVLLVQCILLLAHGFAYATWLAFAGASAPPQALGAGVAALAVTFIPATLLGHRLDNLAVRLFYRLASVWLGFLNFFVWAACLCWLTAAACGLVHAQLNRPLLAATLFSLAALTGVYGLINASLPRLRRIRIEIPALPASWRGRTALVMSDLHLGHVYGAGFTRRLVARANRLQPDIVFLPGDVFDGGLASPGPLVEPLGQLQAPLGVYFAAGNHEEIGDLPLYAEVLERAGVRVLTHQRVEVDGLHILGLPYRDSTYPIPLRASLERLRPQAGEPCILLCHSPSRLSVVEQAGVALMLSGHTHGGQIFPFTWLTRRVFGQFTHGLHRFGRLQVYTSIGAGTWGPPMRVGSASEIVLLTFA
jgi:predicted MPP superfamily phosphohydrolase